MSQIINLQKLKTSLTLFGVQCGFVETLANHPQYFASIRESTLKVKHEALDLYPVSSVCMYTCQHSKARRRNVIKANRTSSLAVNSSSRGDWAESRNHGAEWTTGCWSAVA